MRHVLAFALVVVVTGVGVSAQSAQSAQSTLGEQINAAEARVTSARPSSIAAAEAEGAAYPRASASAASDKPARTCTIVAPDRIVFPSSKGNPVDYNLQSGDFFAGSISFGWGSTYEQAKMPLRPRYPNAVGAGIWLRVIRLDPPGTSTTFEAPLMVYNTSGGPGFFATWPQFPTPGKWMLIATAGANWGCFVLDRPVKTSH